MVTGYGLTGPRLVAVLEGKTVTGAEVYRGAQRIYCVCFLKPRNFETFQFSHGREIVWFV